MDKNSDKFSLPAVSPSDFPICGVVLGVQSDSISYVSKKTNLQTTANRYVIVLQCSFGIVLCRCFNPSLDLTLLPVGASVTLSMQEYRIDNGVKTANVRV